MRRSTGYMERGCERRITSIIVIFDEVNRLSVMADAVAHELAYVRLFFALRLFFDL